MKVFAANVVIEIGDEKLPKVVAQGLVLAESEAEAEEKMKSRVSIVVQDLGGDFARVW